MMNTIISHLSWLHQQRWKRKMLLHLDFSSMKFLRVHFSLLMIISSISACVEPYAPTLDNENINLLVVDGFINASTGATSVTLTRTLPVSSTESMPYETGAFVSVEDSEGLQYPLLESANGYYDGLIPNTSLEKQYRLLITTGNENQYISDFITLQKTSLIDSISYGRLRNGLALYVTTHELSVTPRYYRWTYVETYEYRSDFNSIYMFNSEGEVDERPPVDYIHTCWKTTPSTNIIIGSTAHLKEALVSEFPLIFIPDGSPKLSRKYSVLVQQQVITAEAYNYWLNVQKSTEGLGGLFDPLTSEVVGNIHNKSDAEQSVIGFFSGGSVEEKRIFIMPEDLPDGMGPFSYRNPHCVADTLLLDELAYVLKSTLLVDAIYTPRGGPLIGYTTAATGCVDCRYFGGNTQKPDFWD